MKVIPSAIVIAVLVASALVASAVVAQQAPVPALPPGASAATDTGEAEVLKVYATEEQGAKFRAYVIKYKGSEVIVSDDLAKSDAKVGDKLGFLAIRVEVSSGAEKVHALKFMPLYSPASPSPPKVVSPQIAPKP